MYMYREREYNKYNNNKQNYRNMETAGSKETAGTGKVQGLKNYL